MSDPTKIKAQVNEQEESEKDYSLSGNLGVLSELGGNSISPYNGPAAQYRFPFPTSIAPPPFTLTASQLDLQNPFISPDPRSDNFTTLCHEPPIEEMSHFTHKPSKDKKKSADTHSQPRPKAPAHLQASHGQARGMVQGKQEEGTQTPDQAPQGSSYSEVAFGARTGSVSRNPSGGTFTVTVKVPPGTEQEEVMMHAVMEAFHVTDTEALHTIASERIHFTRYNPLGMGRDQEGQILHKVVLPIALLERTAGDDAAMQDHASPEAQAIYPRFHQWLRQREEEGAKDGERPTASKPIQELFDEWSRKEGKLRPTDRFPELPPTIADLADLTQLPWYPRLRTQVTEMVTWDRLRMHRYGRFMLQNQQQEHEMGNASPIVDELRRLEAAAMNAMPHHLRQQEGYSLNDYAGHHALWVTVREQVNAREDEMLKGIAGDTLGPELTAAMQRLATHTAAAAKEYGGVYALSLRALLEKGEGRSVQDNRMLLAGFYRLSLSLMQAMGRDEEQDPEKGKAMEATARKGKAVLDLAIQHPTAIPVRAQFIPEASLQWMRLGAPDTESTLAQEITLYAWHDSETNEWVLDDLTDRVSAKGGGTKENRAPGPADGPVPDSLFAELNTRLRFPKGALYYKLPNETTERILRTEEKMEWYEWLQWAAMAGLVVATFLPSGGASSLLFTALTASVVGEVAEVMHEREVGVLTPQRVVAHAASLMAGIAATGMVPLKVAGRAGTAAYRTLQYLEVTGDGTGLLFQTAEAAEAVRNHALNNPTDGAGLIRMLTVQLALGTVQGISIKSGLGDIRQQGADLEGPKGNKGNGQSGETRVDDIGGDLGKRQERLSNLEHSKAAKERKLDSHNREKPAHEKRPEVENAAQVPAGSLVLAANGMDTERMRRVLAAALRAIDDLHELGGLALWEIRRLVMTLDIKVTDLAIHLETKKLWAKYGLTPGDTQTLQAILDDIRMVGYSDEARAFVNRYIDVYPNTKLLNVELKWYFENNFVLAESGKFRQAAKEAGTVEPDHMAVVKDSGPLELPEGYDPTTHPHIRQAVEDRKRRQAEFNQAREDLKGREEYATQADVDRVNKARARIGRKSEHISEMTLDDILAGRVLVQDAIQKTRFEIEKADNPEVKAQLERELAAWEAELQATDTEAIMKSMGYKRIYPPGGDPGSKSGDMDRIYVKESGGRTLVMEVKGGESYLGSRQLVNLGEDYKDTRAQQGNGLYLLDVMLEMEKKRIPEVAMLKKALENSTLDMGLFTLKFQKDGEIGEMAMKNFDISAAYENQHLLNGNQR